MVVRRLALLPPASLARCAAAAPGTPARRLPLLRPATSGLIAGSTTTTTTTGAPSPSWAATATRSLATTRARLEATRPDPPAAAPPKPPSPEDHQQPPPPPPPEPHAAAPPPRRLRRTRRGLVYALAFLCLGATLGSMVRLALAPPPPPTPGSAADRDLVAYFRQRGEELPVVRELTADPAWESWDAYGADGEDIGAGETAADPAAPAGAAGRRGRLHERLTSGALAGVRGLPFQRVFWNRATGELVTVVYFGAGTAGFPGVVHGGALATVLDETLGRCAILRFPARTGVTARLELDYRKPAHTAAFYVLRARPCPDAPQSDRKLWVEGTVETTDGRPCVAARALFVVPKGLKLKPLETRF